LSTDAQNLRQAIYNIIKNKIQLNKLDDGEVVRQGLSRVV